MTRRDAGRQVRARSSRMLGPRDPRWDRNMQQETNPDSYGPGLVVQDGKLQVQKARRPRLTGDASADLAALIQLLVEAGLVEE